MYLIDWCVSSDKAVLRGIAPSVGSKVSPAWNSTGDPCNDRWYGVTCDASGYVTQIKLSHQALSGIISLSCSYCICIIHIFVYVRKQVFYRFCYSIKQFISTACSNHA